MSFGSKLKGLRLAMDWSVDEVEKRAGVSRKTIYALEAGERLPNLHTAIRLAAALGVTLNDMCEREMAHERETLRETLYNVSRGTDGGRET